MTEQSEIDSDQPRRYRPSRAQWTVVLGVLTAEQRALRTRAVLQVVLFAAVLCFGCPALAFAATGTEWATLPAHFGGPEDLLLVQVAALIAIIALRALADSPITGAPRIRGIRRAGW
jgi:hypothetical protein